MRNVIITTHAMRRARKRLGIKKKAVQRTANTAFIDGQNLCDLSRDWALIQEHRPDVIFKLHNNYIWVFGLNKVEMLPTLITVLQRTLDNPFADGVKKDVYLGGELVIRGKYD